MISSVPSPVSGIDNEADNVNVSATVEISDKDKDANNWDKKSAPMPVSSIDNSVEISIKSPPNMVSVMPNKAANVWSSTPAPNSKDDNDADILGLSSAVPVSSTDLD